MKYAIISIIERGIDIVSTLVCDTIVPNKVLRPTMNSDLRESYDNLLSGKLPLRSKSTPEIAIKSIVLDYLDIIKQDITDMAPTVIDRPATEITFENIALYCSMSLKDGILSLTRKNITRTIIKDIALAQKNPTVNNLDVICKEELILKKFDSLRSDFRSVISNENAQDSKDEIDKTFQLAIGTRRETKNCRRNITRALN